MRVSTAEFIDGFDAIAGRAEAEPVTITDGGRDRLVLVSADEYARLKGRGAGLAEASARDAADDLVSPAGELPGLWGALRGMVCWDSDSDVTEPTGEIWKAER